MLSSDRNQWMVGDHKPFHTKWFPTTNNHYNIDNLYFILFLVECIQQLHKTDLFFLKFSLSIQNHTKQYDNIDLIKYSPMSNHHGLSIYYASPPKPQPILRL